MKQIEIPQPSEVPVFDNEGSPWKDDDGSPMRMSFARFCRSVIMHASFADGLDAIEATELRLKVKKKLDALKPEAKVFLLEDDEARRLQKSVKAITPMPFIAMACIGFMRAIMAAHEPPAEQDEAAARPAN